MVALMDKLERDGGLQGKATPFEWQLLLDAFGQAKSAAAVNLETLHPVTLLAWQTGYDATMSETSQPRAGGKQWHSRASVFGLAVMYCIVWRSGAAPSVSSVC